MTPEQIATKQRSPEADALHFEALRLVAWTMRDAPWPWDENDPVRYRSAVGILANRRMLEELEPINRELSRLAFMSIGPITVPPAVEELRQSIHDKWAGIVAELLPATASPPPATPPAPPA